MKCHLVRLNGERREFLEGCYASREAADAARVVAESRDKECIFLVHEFEGQCNCHQKKKG